MRDAGGHTLKDARAAVGRGDLARAGALYRTLLRRDPGEPEALQFFARLALQAGRDADAVPLLERALERHGLPAACHADLAMALQNLGLNEQAADQAQRALDLAPGQISALNTLGNARVALGRLDAAVECFERAVAQAPEHALLRRNLADARLGLAQASAAQQRHDEALVQFSRLAEQFPDDAELRGGIGNALRALGRLDEAAVAYAGAVALRPESAPALCNLSTVELDLGRTHEAIEHARRAIAAQPDLTDAHWNLAQGLLTLGEWVEGWRKYEYRFLRTGAAELSLPWPQWEGSPLGDRTLFVAAEQGVGDEIMFAACVPDLLNDAASCVLECDTRLVPLFARSFPTATVIARLDAAQRYAPALPQPACRIAMGSLPLRYRGGPESFPRRHAYLVPEPARVDEWRGRYAALGAGLKVGISWRGGKEALVRRARSIELSDWAGLGSDVPAQFISLQYGDTRGEISAVRADAGLVVHDWGDADALADLDGFAARIAALDLVISIDNSTVHMAGAVGTPAWVLLPHAADWRWMTDRRDSPWYPSIRLFRQPEPGAWRPVLERVRVELGQHASVDTRAAAANRRASAAFAGSGTSVPPRPTAAPRRRPREWAALLNDTTHWYHWGCAGTSMGLASLQDERGYAVNRIPIAGLYALEQVPDTLEAFDDPACFRRFRAANPWLERELDYADHVVVNGEGSLHGLNDYVRGLLYVIFAAKVHMGRDVQIVNHSCYPSGGDEVSESVAWRLYRKVYDAVDFVAIREPASLGLMKRAGIEVVQAFDCLPLTIARDYVPTGERRDDEIVIAGSVAMREPDLVAWATFVRDSVARGLRVRALLGASMFPAPEERAFVEALERSLPRAIEVVTAGRLSQWLDVIAQAGVLVSGRFHHTIAAAALGTPFVLLASNTPKNAGLAEVLQAPPPIPLDALDLAGELTARANRALSDGPDAARDRVAKPERLWELASKNAPEVAASPRTSSTAQPI